MERKVLLFKEERQVEAFAHALARAVPTPVQIRRDLGWTWPALEVQASEAQLLAAVMWAGFEPVHVVE
ncbi:hypothetical protein [Thermus caldifontis]|uniref:hypothetical protein n=1 Tax=Thermus caldifontis TaxID=1930763 RepID=UPI000DF4A330|nr:hypothetical protein [Thermus caldifontis]